MCPTLVALMLSAAQAVPPAVPIVPGRDTTFVTGPLRPDGGIDYQAALNERRGVGVTPETNAVARLWAAIGPRTEVGEMPAEFFARLGVPRPPDAGDYLVPFYRFLLVVKKFDSDERAKATEQQRRAIVAPWSRAELPLVAEWLALNDKPLAVEATRRPHYFRPLASKGDAGGPGPMFLVPMPDVERNREIAVLLSARAMLRTSEGQFDAAWGDLLAAYRLGRLSARGGAVMERLVGGNVEAIADRATRRHVAAAKPDAATLRRRLADVRALPSVPPLADTVDLTERLCHLDTIQRFVRGGTKAVDGLFEPRDGFPAVGPEEPRRFDWNPTLREGNRWHDRLAAALRLPTRAARERELARLEGEARALWPRGRGLGALYTEILTAKAAGKSAEDVRRDELVRSIGHALVAPLVPALRSAAEADDRTAQAARHRELFLALALCRAERGRYPATLAELSPEFLPAVPDDLFADRPLTYRAEGEGYLLYSVGPNGKDEAGRWYDDEPRGDDPNVRVPLPPLKKG